MDYQNILADLSSYIKETIEINGPKLPYHNLDHIEKVVATAGELCQQYQLNEEDSFIVLAAAWFHDIGIEDNKIKGHEIRSAAKAEEWLRAKEVPDAVIGKVKGCILATKMPQNPATMLEQILDDADLWNLGTENFSANQKLLRLEKAGIEGKEIETEDWRAQNIELLSRHSYHTDYAKSLLESKKQEHLTRLLAKQEKKNMAPEANEKEKGNEKVKVKDKDIKPKRGIETMFRLTTRNNLELSSMADSKANIMISVNSIIVSVVLSVLLRRLEEYPNLIVPTILLLTVNVVTIVFAVITVRPKIIKDRKPEEITDDKKTNLLFFGNFNQMSLDEYTHQMKGLIKNEKDLQDSLINSIYFMGIVLAKKYKSLRIAYNVFMYGFILVVILFGIAVII